MHNLQIPRQIIPAGIRIINANILVNEREDIRRVIPLVDGRRASTGVLPLGDPVQHREEVRKEKIINAPVSLRLNLGQEPPYAA